MSPMTIPRLVLPLGFVVRAGPRRDRRRSLTPSTPQARRPDGRAGRRGRPPRRRHRAVAPAYSCAAITCRVVTELDNGAIVSVVKTDGEWHQVLVRTSANAMTTGWVKTAQVSATSGNTVRTGDNRTDGMFRPTPGAAWPARRRGARRARLPDLSRDARADA